MPDSGEMVPMLSELGIKHEMELKLFPKNPILDFRPSLATSKNDDHAEAAASGELNFQR